MPDGGSPNRSVGFLPLSVSYRWSRKIDRFIKHPVPENGNEVPIGQFLTGFFYWRFL
jgi:hypothetical protein